MSIPPSQRQKCPICENWVDVSNFTTGQRTRCPRCAIAFVVRKSDVPLRGSTQLNSYRQPDLSSEAKTEVPVFSEEMAESVTIPEHPVRRGPQSDSGVQIQRLIHPPKDAPPPTPRAPIAPPQTVTSPAPKLPNFEGYTLIERKGQGGMGEVWKARRNADGRLVAIKVLATEYAHDESLCVRFEKEVAALASLNHPGIVKLVDRDCRRRPPFFAMELCEGQTLREKMCSPSFNIAQRLATFSYLCRVLAHAHARGVVHRDLKPDNVLFDAQGNLKLIDFGLAAMTKGDPRYQLTQAAMTMGTADYMPPEQRTDARSVDERGDVWSLGIILYELMSGRLPVGQFKPLVEQMPGLDPRIDDLIRKALVPDRNKRLQSSEEMADAIDEIRKAFEKPKPRPTPKQSTLTRLKGLLRKS